MSLKHNEEWRTFINDIPAEEPSFEAMTNYKDDENMSLKESVYLADGFEWHQKYKEKKIYHIYLKICYVAYTK